MINPVSQGAPSAAVPDPASSDAGSARSGTAPPPAPPASAKKADAGAPTPAPDAGRNDLRLIIERAADHQAFVYKLVEPNTGQVVVELPRGQVKQMASSPDYAAGDLVSTSA